jgi:hypothetical protein
MILYELYNNISLEAKLSSSFIAGREHEPFLHGFPCPAAKAPPGSNGIFFDRSRHVECVIMMTNSGSKGK